jgi:hypothetical protein
VKTLAEEGTTVSGAMVLAEQARVHRTVNARAYRVGGRTEMRLSRELWCMAPGCKRRVILKDGEPCPPLDRLVCRGCRKKGAAKYVERHVLLKGAA